MTHQQIEYLWLVLTALALALGLAPYFEIDLAINRPLLEALRRTANL